MLPLLLAALATLPTSQEEAEAPEPYWAFVLQVDGLRSPDSAALGAEGELFVSETDAHRVAVLAPDGRRLRTLGAGPGSGPGELLAPRGLALDAAGRLLVADSGNDRVAVFDTGGEWLGAFGGRGSGAGELRRPRGIAVGAGRVFVCDAGNDRVVVFDAEGAPVATVGGFGAAPGRLDTPLDVAAGPEGGFTVVDSGNSRLQTFDAEGRLVRAWSDWGAFAGLLDGPSGLWRDGSRLLVAEANNHRIQEFSLEGRVQGQWGVHALRPREGSGKLHYPSDVVLDASGTRAVVCEALEDRIQVFEYGADSELPPPRNLVPPGATPHYGMRFDTLGDLLAIVEPVTHSVLLLDRDAGDPVVVHSLGGRGRRHGQLAVPSDVFLEREPWTLWVVDRGNRRLQAFALAHRPDEPLKFLPDLSRLVRSIDLDAVLGGGADVAPVDPVAVARDGDGRTYVLDARNTCVWVLDDSLALERRFGAYGDGPGEMLEPTDLALDPAGERVHVVDSLGARVLVFDREGALLDTVGARGPAPAGLEAPFGVVVAPDGALYVTDAGRHTVVVLDRDGELLRTLGGEGLLGGELFKPRGVALDADGHLVVLDHGNHRGQVLTTEGAFLRAFGSRLYVRAATPRTARSAPRKE